MYDHYSVAEKIAEQLEKEGHVTEASQIRGDLSAFSGTEIFMGLRSHLQEFTSRNGGFSEEIEAMMRELLNRVVDALS